MVDTGSRAATFGETFASGEFRALTGSFLLSLVGDQLAKVAVSVLVYARTGSALLSAIAFGISYLPWIVGGPLLSSLADRFPRRTVLVVCDVARAVLIGCLVIPGMPLAGLLALLFVAELFSPPFESARSATLPDILSDDRYVVGTSITNVVLQVGQVVGFAVGGAAVALVHTRGALLLDAATFLASAALIQLRVRHRPAPPGQQPPSLWSDARDGIRMVFGNRTLLTYVSLAWLAPMFVYGPEGIMAPYARHLGGGAMTVGLLLAASPLGLSAGMLLLGRFVRPERRVRLVRPLALLTCALLVPLVADPPLPVTLVLLALSGVGMAFNLPLNALFVQAVPAAYRGRAFGIAGTGMFLAQGLGVLLAGAAASHANPALVTGISGALGALCLLPILAGWSTDDPSPVMLPGERLDELHSAEASGSDTPARPGPAEGTRTLQEPPDVAQTGGRHRT